MECPFLRESKVKYCQASAYRKMILESAAKPELEKCSSSGYGDCAAAAARMDTPSAQPDPHCPFLEDALVEYCGAAAVTKFIPASNALLSRCKSDGHLYCELFLAHADPVGERLPASAGGPRDSTAHERTPIVEGVPVPSHLWYAENHMWLDIAPDGACHVGIDGFLARVIGSADNVTFVSSRTAERPVAVLTVGGADLQLAFPNPIHQAAANVYLRTSTAKLTADPYGAGWLFEGVEPIAHVSVPGDSIRSGLIRGDHAVDWFRSESDRLTDFVHDRMSRPGPDGRVFMADGGRVEPGVATLLGRDDVIDLFNEFFTHGRRSW